MNNKSISQRITALFISSLTSTITLHPELNAIAQTATSPATTPKFARLQDADVIASQTKAQQLLNTEQSIANVPKVSASIVPNNSPVIKLSRRPVSLPNGADIIPPQKSPGSE